MRFGGDSGHCVMAIRCGKTHFAKRQIDNLPCVAAITSNEKAEDGGIPVLRVYREDNAISYFTIVGRNASNITPRARAAQFFPHHRR